MSSDLFTATPIVEKPSIYATSRSYIKRCSLYFVILLSVAISAATFCGAVAAVPSSSSADAALWRAIADDDTNGVIAALKSGAYVDSRKMPEDVFNRWWQPKELEGASPLFAAIYLKKSDLALLLLAHGADPKIPGIWGCTPVQVAAAIGDEKVFSALLSKGADIFSEPAIPDDPEQLRLIALLLERGADINAAIKTGDQEGWTPLMFAVSENKPELVDLLAGKGASADALGLSMIEIEVAKPWDQKPKTITPLLKAAQLGRVDMIRSMIQAGAKIDQTNSEDYTALMVAARFGQVEAVKALLQLGADTTPINDHRSGVLELAVISKNIAIQKFLLGRTGAGEREDALVVAARLGDFETLDELLQGDAFKGRVLNRALLAAIRANPEDAKPRDLIMQEDEGLARLKIIKVLVAAGADSSTNVYRGSPYSTLIYDGYDTWI